MAIPPFNISASAYNNDPFGDFIQEVLKEYGISEADLSDSVVFCEKMKLIELGKFDESLEIKSSKTYNRSFGWSANLNSDNLSFTVNYQYFVDYIRKRYNINSEDYSFSNIRSMEDVRSNLDSLLREIKINKTLIDKWG